MIDYFRKLFIGQFEASLCMLRQAIVICPDEHWERKIAYGTIRWAAYHTLFYTDLYLSRTEKDFVPQELHKIGGDEREPVACKGLERSAALEYLAFCRAKVHTALAAETVETILGPSGISWYPITRGELHTVNIRHIQHHTAQIAAYLRREKIVGEQDRTLSWIGTGWRD